MNFNRIACLYVAGFPLAVLVKDPTKRAETPWAVAADNHPNAPVVAISEAAARYIEPGMTVSQGRSRCSELQVLVRDYDRERTEAQRLHHRFQQVGPHVEQAEPGRYYLEVDGLTMLYQGESGIVQKVLAVVTDTPYRIQIGIAGNKLVAWIAARLAAAGSSVIVPPAAERQFIAPLPITALPLADDTRERLHLLGLNLVRDLAQLPSHALTERFGHDVQAIARYVRGEDASPLVSAELSQKHSASLHLDYTIASQEYLCEHIALLLEPLLLKLQRNGQQCAAIHLHLTDEPAGPAVTIRLDTPSANLSRWMRHIRRRLEQIPLSHATADITVTLDEVLSQAPDQLHLSGPVAPPADSRPPGNHPDKIRVSTVELRDSILPERSFSFLEDKAPKPRGLTPGILPPVRYTARRIRGLRLYQPSQAVRVLTDEGKIRLVHINRRPTAVAEQAGPWYLSGEWWENGFARWYYDITTAEGATYLLYYDAGRARWFLHGIFD